MSGLRRSYRSRAILCGVAASLVFVLAGDRGARTAPLVGIDPLEILDLSVKNNVVFVFDTSGSMKWPTAVDNFSVGADDPLSRLYQAKQAVKAVVQQNVGKLNFGLLSYNLLASSKTINRNQDFDNDGAGSGDRLDGPFIYVSADNTGASPFYLPYPCPNQANATRDGFFCRTSDTFTNYDGATSAEVFQSFQNRSGTDPGNGFFDDPYPPVCSPFDPVVNAFVDTTHCHFYLQSKLFRSGVQYTWNLTSTDNTTRLVSTAAVTCPLPPAGLVGDNPDADANGFADRPTPCIEMVDQATGNVARFFFSSAIFQADTGASFCAGAAVLNTVSDCTGDNSDEVIAQMAQELPVTSDTTIPGLPPANTIQSYTTGIDPTPAGGLRADQATPIAASLNDIRTAAAPPIFPPRPAAVANVQRNFVIFLTDGDDTCAGGSLDSNATAAAQAAEALYYNGGPPATTTDPQHNAETMFIAFAASVNIARSNKIAQAGSGGNVQPDGSVVCPGTDPNGACRDAFTASTTQELIDALNNALQFAIGSGTFSASTATVATVFELLGDDPSTPLPVVETPLDPDTRYDRRVNIFFLPTFDIPGWKGHLYAFQNSSFVPTPSTFSGDWDAGEALFENVSQYLEAQIRSGRPVNQFTFAELHAGATVDDATGGGTALIRRRIFTSDNNGRFPRTSTNQFDAGSATGRNVVALWPPNQTGLTNTKGDIDPPVGTTGPLDDALGISTLTFAELKSQFGACDFSTDPSSGPLPSSCDDVADLALATSTALKEAREVILAYVAGARVDRSSIDNRPRRDATTSELIFRDRGWLLTESTLSQPAVVTPPFRARPEVHRREFLLFRDGRRDGNRLGIPEIDLGFGLRNPDIADPNPQSLTDLKPVMTVVYIGTNAMLHAFKAETSEELWGFVPFDQLGKLKDLMKPQTRDTKTYVVSSSVRFEAVFIPGPFTAGGVSFDGRWRNMLVVGRGPGGKYYTALDVTSPGPFTRPALQTNPPWVMWSRGNPDTVDGTPTGTPIRAADTTAYAAMGQTWSVPAIGNVRPSPAPVAPPGGFGPEWRLFTGSGYGSTPNEGTTFYALDVETGDVIYSKDVGDGSNTYFSDNALVASPSGYNAFFLDNINTATFRSEDVVTRVYIPDLHGRIWKFSAGTAGKFADEGPAQPFGDGLALIKLLDTSTPPPTERAFVFGAAGNDNRVAPPPAVTPPFKMFAYKDVGGDTQTPEAGVPAFTEDFPSPFRGTSRPATFFNTNGEGRVAFSGTRFNPPENVDCISSFDTILFVIGAETGAAVYDFGSGYAKSTILTDIKDAVSASGGELIVSDSGSRTRSPAPPSPQPSPPGSGVTPPEVKVLTSATGSPVCR